MHLLVAEACLPQDLRLHHEGDEILEPLPLDQHLRPLLVDGDIELLLARGIERVGLLREGESSLLQDRPQLFGLLRAQGIGL